MVVRNCLCDTLWLSKLSNEQLCQLRSNHLAQNLGCHGENFLVVNADDFDNFLVDNTFEDFSTTFRFVCSSPADRCQNRAYCSLLAGSTKPCVLVQLVI